MFSCHMWLVAAMFDGTDVEHFHHHRKSQSVIKERSAYFIRNAYENVELLCVFIWVTV